MNKEDTYKIDAAGYDGSKRGAKDGFTYIGTADRNDVTGNCPNDIVIPSEENGMGATHLLIQYQANYKAYFIKDCGQGTGTFIKIELPLKLKQ